MQEQNVLDKLSDRVNQVVQRYNDIRGEVEHLRNENGGKQAEIERLREEIAMKDLEIEEIVSKIESILG